MVSDNQSDQPTQKTPKGLEIPIPSAEDFAAMVKKAATTKPQRSTPRRSPKN
jgi:hypothetical protein